MKVSSFTRLVEASAFLLALTQAVPSEVHAEMVYDEEVKMSPAPSAAISARQPITQTTVVQTETISTPEVVVETSSMKKSSERAREKRAFQEQVSNELVLQRLEDRRLKQEERLTNEVNQKFNLDEPAGTAAPVAAQVVTAAPIADAAATSYVMSPAPQNVAIAPKTIQADQVVVTQSSASGLSVSEGESKSSSSSSAGKISVLPRGGFSTINNPFYDFRNEFVLGMAMGFQASDYISLELGYSYSSYQVGLQMPMTFQGYYYSPMSFKNNSFDFVSKFYLFGNKFVLRPFLGGGVGYSIGYVNYNQNLTYVQTPDYQLNQFQGILQAGLDFKLGESFTAGFTWRRSMPIASTESVDGLNNGGFYNPYAGYGALYMDPNKVAVSGTLRDSTAQFYMVHLGVTF